jgi:hypothetical protein
MYGSPLSGPNGMSDLWCKWVQSHPFEPTVGPPVSSFTCGSIWGFPKIWGYPNWVVYFMENHFKMGDLGVPPWLRKHPYLFGKKHMRSSFSCFEQHLRDHPLHPQKLTLPTGLWSGSPRKMGRGWLAALCSWPLHRFALGLRAAAFEGGPGGATSGGTGRNQLQFPFIKCQDKIELVFWHGFHLISPLLSFFGWVCYT